MEIVTSLATVLVAVFSSSAAAAFVANRANYKSIAVEAITKERITWLDELRKIAEDFSASASEVALSANVETNRTRELDRLSARMELQLSPDGEQENKIIQAGKKMISAARARSVDFREAEKNFMLKTRKLLKAEWNKAKAEAGVKPSKNREVH